MLKQGLMLATLLTSGHSLANAECTLAIDSTDTMQFQVAGKKLDKIEVPKSCAKFTIKHKHIGKLPVQAMGHNWLLTKTQDAPSVQAEAIKLGPAKGYTPKVEGKVLAGSKKLLGGGESEEIVFDVKKVMAAGTDLTFFCSFPGHSALMSGKLIFK